MSKPFLSWNSGRWRSASSLKEAHRVERVGEIAALPAEPAHCRRRALGRHEHRYRNTFPTFPLHLAMEYPAFQEPSTEFKSYVPERDFVGYGDDSPRDCWPDGKKIYVSFILNCELRCN